MKISCVHNYYLKNYEKSPTLTTIGTKMLSHAQLVLANLNLAIFYYLFFIFIIKLFYFCMK
jgi:hypothetical protein